MLKTSLLSLVFLVNLTNISAQNYGDALRFSQLFYQSTARSAATGNSFGALGGDFSCVSLNPAGIGTFRKNDFSTGLSYNGTSTKSMYHNILSKDFKYNLNIPDFGFVVTNINKDEKEKPLTKGWVALNFAFGLLRVNNFHNNSILDAPNKETSILEDWREKAQGRNPTKLGPFSYSFLAFNAFLIDTLGGDTNYIDATQYEDSNFSVQQTDYLQTRGSSYDFSAAIAWNYSNKIYVGAALYFPVVGYRFVRSFTEYNLVSKPRYYESCELNENLRTTGYGVSAGAGLIYRFNDQVRLGTSVRFPTFYTLKDVYSDSISAGFTSFSAHASTPRGVSKYSLITPAQLTLSASYVLGKFGFLSADYEIKDYGSARLGLDEKNQRYQNQLIDEIYRTTGNLRFGTEWRVDYFAFRGGINLIGSPYELSKNIVPDKQKGNTILYSLGIGTRNDKNYFDIGYQQSHSDYFYLPYTIKKSNTLRNVEVKGADISMNRWNLMVTFGSRF